MQSEKRTERKISVFFLVPAPPGISPGQRFRFEHYLGYLSEKNIDYKISSFYSPSGWKAIFTHGNSFRKGLIVVRGFCKRAIDLLRLVRYDYIFIYREVAPIGPPICEWIIAKLFRKKIIYDFDDAIWIPASSQYNKAAAYFKWFGKIASICRWSHKVSVGNDYLAQYALRQNGNTIVIPTVVDTRIVHNRIQDQLTANPVIGWTGTFSTLKYLDIVLPVLQRLQETFGFTFVVIANKDPKLALKNYKFIDWQKETETNDLLNMHIGLMPLYDDELSKGKCGFKAIQYMSLGIPAVVSPVGVNSQIVDDGINGFVCDQPGEWEAKLTELLMRSDLRQKLGVAARAKIESAYSVLATRDLFLSLFS